MKIWMIGSVASGKTTLARKWQQELGIPYFELDIFVHGPKEDRFKRSKKEQWHEIKEMDKAGNWIVEGTYRESYHDLFRLADWVIFLDPPLALRKKRIWRHYLKQKWGLEKSHYSSNLKMLQAMYRWTKAFEKNRPDFLEMLERDSNHYICIQDETELEPLLEHLKDLLSKKMTEKD